MEAGRGQKLYCERSLWHSNSMVGSSHIATSRILEQDQRSWFLVCYNTTSEFYLNSTSSLQWVTFLLHTSNYTKFNFLFLHWSISTYVISNSYSPSHGSYRWIIMLEKCGHSHLNVFQLKWIIGTHGNWKNPNPGGWFGATS